MFRSLLYLAAVSAVYGSDTNYRLNTPIKPIAYSIAITPYFETGDERAFTFDGEVDITFKTDTAINQIKLHSEDLIFSQDNITVNGAVSVALNATDGLVFDKNYTFAYINLQNNLNVDVEYSLKILYRGPIRDDLNGFYRNYYFENGVKRWLGATQMEPTHARKAFPCFDEPELKATFTLTIDRPANYSQSLANTKLQSSYSLPNGFVREIFYPTPKMSTYLVAFLVSEFKGVTGNDSLKEFGVYARPDAVNQTEYALDFGQRVVKALGDFFGIDYYSTDEHLKLDHVALPDFRAGAMENWGLVKYRESLFLYDPLVSNPYYKYRVAQIVAHETTHMWFGNLVTCHWWSNTWLNEGFANYFQDYITSLIEPEVASTNILVIGSVYDAYNADESPTSPALTNNDVNSPAEISGHFGTITYQKGGSVIRMMHHFIGDDAFKFGLNQYLRTRQFNSGYPENMFDALNNGVQNASSLQAYPETTIIDVMNSWVSQPGHPVLNVEINYDTDAVILRQKRFFINSAESSKEIYKIPITYTTGLNPDFSNTKPAFVMHNETHQFTIANISQQQSWVLFNIQETGFYRVNYDTQSWKVIASALKSDLREQIHHLNRAKIVNDLFAFLYADVVDFNLLHDVLTFLSQENEYTVWYATVRGLNKLWYSYIGSDLETDIQDYALQIISNKVSYLGYEERESDDFETLRNRMQLLEFACDLGHQGCIDNTVKLFKGLRENGTEISPSLRPVAYCNGLRYGDASDYDFLWNRMAKTNVASEAKVIMESLGCTSDEDKLRSYLVSMTIEDSPIRAQDLTVPLASVLGDYKNLHIVMEQLKTNYTVWDEIYPSMDTILSTVASSLHTEKDFTEFQSFLNACDQCTAEDRISALAALTRARSVTKWASDHRDQILRNLRSNSFVITSSMPIVASLAIIIMQF